MDSSFMLIEQSLFNGLYEDPFEVFLGFEKVSDVFRFQTKKEFDDDEMTEPGSPFKSDSKFQGQFQNNFEKGGMLMMMGNQSKHQNQLRQEGLENSQIMEAITAAMENEAATFDEESQYQTEFCSAGKGLSKIQSGIIKLIKVIVTEEAHGNVNLLLKRFQTQLTAEVTAVSENAMRKDSIQQMIKSKRGNQTRYTRTLLKSMALALIEMRSYAPGHLLRSLPGKIEKCLKIKDLSDVIADSNYSQFRLLLQGFVEPGDKFIRLLQRSYYPPIIKMLLLETLPALRMMANNSSEGVTSWDAKKLQTKGDYSEALKLIEESKQVRLPEVMQIVLQEYKRVKKSFSKRSCSLGNNTIHFLIKLTRMMLERIRGTFTRSGQVTIKIKTINSSLQLLQKAQVEASIQEATKQQWLKDLIYDEFISSGILLKEILNMENTSALVIYNIMTRYTSFVMKLTGRTLRVSADS